MLTHPRFRRARATVLGLLALAGLALMPRPAAAQDASGFIANLGHQGIQALGPSVPTAQRAATFSRIFSADFDMQGAARFVMGPYWSRLTPEQQQEFQPLFRDYLAHAYASRLSQYGGEQFHVTGSRPNGNETIVASQVVRRGGNPIEMDWHVVNGNGRFLVSDVYVDGVSMRLTHRQEFASIIQRNGGRPDAVLAALRQQIAQTGVGSSHPSGASPTPAYAPAYGR